MQSVTTEPMLSELGKIFRTTDYADVEIRIGDWAGYFGTCEASTNSSGLN